MDFPNPVRVDNGNLVAAFYIKETLRKIPLSSVGFGKLLRMQYIIAACQKGGLGSAASDPAGHPACPHAPACRGLSRGFPRALMDFFAVEGAQCADDILLMLDFLLLHFVCLLLNFTVDFLLLPKEGIIPVINRRFLIFDFNDLCHNAVKEIAVGK